MFSFSIITPYYNNADTINSCVESVLSQTYPNWELLLIDDGTPKALPVSFSDSRFKIFRQSHQGVSAARNRGILESSGDYILFLDADDYLDKNYLHDFAHALQDNPSEIALSGLTRIEFDGTTRTLTFPFSGIVSKEVILPSFFQIQQTTQLYGYVAGKAVNRLFLTKNQLLFDESLHLAEDMEFFLRCYDKCDSFLFISNTGYHYVKRSSGSSLYQQHVDYFSRITAQRRLRTFCEGHLSQTDKDVLRRKISSWADSAILDSRLDRLSTTLRTISQDSELRTLCHIHGPFFLLAIRIMMRHLRLFFARLLRKIWHE